jgi:hypothetical protein
VRELSPGDERLHNTPEYSRASRGHQDRILLHHRCGILSDFSGDAMTELRICGVHLEALADERQEDDDDRVIRLVAHRPKREREADLDIIDDKVRLASAPKRWRPGRSLKESAAMWCRRGKTNARWPGARSNGSLSRTTQSVCSSIPATIFPAQGDARTRRSGPRLEHAAKYHDGPHQHASDHENNHDRADCHLFCPSP